MTPLADRLLPWYHANHRQLPWRDQPDPYAVWVSEIMLQQTRVETVLPYFARWMAAFPDVHSLARADEQEALRLWEGLGYYSRARSLHRAARIVAEEYGGQIPDDVHRLGKLPGIGRYTAGAIASIAFNRDEPIVDGNVRRLFARVYNLEIPADSVEGQRWLWQKAAEVLPPGNARDFNQALMELGALTCTPRKPACPDCPLNDHCEARRLGLQDARPVLKEKAKTPHLTVTAAVIRRDGHVLIARRPDSGLLGGLWEFPGGKVEPGESLQTCLEREIDEELGVRVVVEDPVGVFKHAYTHFRVTLHAFDCRIEPDAQQPQAIGVAALRWVRDAQLAEFPMGKIDRQICARISAIQAS